MKIAVVGLGYVGLSNAIVLGKHNNVVAFDIDKSRVDNINDRISPVEDSLASDLLQHGDLDLKATSDFFDAVKDARFTIIATPTNYDPETQYFDTKTIESVIAKAEDGGCQTTFIIKSTIPVGYVKSLRERFKSEIIFSPEFLREGSAVEDNLNPSRIIVGGNSESAKLFGELMVQASLSKGVPLLFTSSTEAESIKLFSNTYLAMRVSFFNELDSFALKNDLNSKEIVDGICLDPRIGQGYNNPSFGYGGYCLPKDTKQLLANYGSIPQVLISAIVESNDRRKDLIAEEVSQRNNGTVGIFRLVMKAGSDNFRSSSIQGIIRRLQERDIPVIIYEPAATETTFLGAPIVNDLSEFKETSDVIVANRLSTEIADVKQKVFTRDLFGIC